MNNGQKILARIVELTNSPLNIVGSRAIGTSTEASKGYFSSIST